MILVLGAGVGGQIVAEISRDYDEVKLVGPATVAPGGLFYINKRLPGLTTKKIDVAYTSDKPLSDETYKTYQIKSRGTYNPEIKVSSLDKVGTTSAGYLLRDFDLDDIQVKCNCKFIDLENQYILTSESDQPLFYDYLISTIPINIFFKLALDLDVSADMIYSPIHLKEEEYFVEDENVSKILVEYNVSEDTDIYRKNIYQNKEGITIKASSESIKSLNDETRVIYPGKIIPSKLLSQRVKEVEDSYTNIKLLGRYARWSYHWTLDQTYSEAKNFLNTNYGGIKNGKN